MQKAQIQIIKTQKTLSNLKTYRQTKSKFKKRPSVCNIYFLFSYQLWWLEEKLLGHLEWSTSNNFSKYRILNCDRHRTCWRTDSIQWSHWETKIEILIKIREKKFFWFNISNNFLLDYFAITNNYTFFVASLLIKCN